MTDIKGRADRFLTKILSGESMTYKQIFSIFLPIWVDQMFITSLNMLNTAMVSSSGVAAVSAVSMVDSLNLFLLNVFVAIATGGTVIVAQYKGNSDPAMMSKAAVQALVTVTYLAVGLAVILLIFQGPTLTLLFGAAEQEVLSNAQTYMVASYISYPCFAIYQAVCGALRGAADTKSSLVISLITNISYVLMNFFFINLLQMGVLGLSISLNLSRLLGMLCAMLYLLKLNHSFAIEWRDLFHFDFTIQKRILTVGIPFAAEQLFFNGGKLLTQTFVVQLGTLSMTVLAICNSLTSLTQITGNAIGLTTVTVVGQCMGRGDVRDSKKFAKSLLLVSCVTFVIFELILYPFMPILIQLFSPPAEIVGTIWTILIFTGIANPLLWSMSFIMPNTLRAAGDSNFTSIASMLSMWLFRVILGYVVGIMLGFGIVGVWVAMLLEWGVRSLIFMLRFRSGRWSRHKLI